MDNSCEVCQPNDGLLIERGFSLAPPARLQAANDFAMAKVHEQTGGNLLPEGVAAVAPPKVFLRHRQPLCFVRCVRGCSGCPSNSWVLSVSSSFV